ncbi:MAG: alpha-ketoacid dehydrogenase subunit beta [Firmicutes bacterium]|nr:alpha-ketoacid dehydrogenase subunit beta [Bacillota bacterium]
MRKITMREALNEALFEEMERNKNTLCFGEDVGYIGGIFGVTRGLQEKFGKERVWDTPIAECTIVGAALGMAITGLVPIAEMQFADFMAVAFDEVHNKLGKWRYMHGGKFEVPVTLRLPIGISGGAGPEHSQSPQALFVHSQGLYVVIPSNPRDAKGLLKQAIRDPNPVLFFEHKKLYEVKGEVEEEEFLIPFGKAAVKKQGTDVTIVATALQVTTALEAAELLEKDNISVEVIDPRTLVPLDTDTIFESIKKTGRLVIVHEDPKRGGTGAEIAALVAEELLFDLEAPIKRVAGPDVPIAQNIHLEKYYVPSVEDIIEAVKETLD